VTTSVVLDADLTGCAVGLVVGADGITVDLNGHSITGTGRSNGANLVYGDTEDGVDNTAGHVRVTIENGRIQGFDTGVKLHDANANHLTGLELDRNLAGILLLESQGNLIERNHADQNSYGLYPYESNGNTIVDNELTGNVFGAYPVESSDNLIEGNTILFSGILGMQVVEDSNRNRILSNVIDVSGFVGVVLGGSTDNVLEDNQLTRHPGFGVIIANTARTEVRHNTIGPPNSHGASPPPQAGVTLGVSNHDVTLGRNSVTGYPIGLHLDGPETGLRVVRNQVFGNTGDGIFVGESIAGLVDRNVAHHNGDDGIDVRGSGTKLFRNLAYSNGDYGIEAVPGADGGGNLAWGNGNPAQCLNVVCSG
jgi:parallel beta-helix repeat protein